MICPKCRSDTRVVFSRPHPDDATVIVRRRHCVACPHRFDTFESTRNVVKLRKNSRAGKAQWVAETPADVLAEKSRVYGLRRDAKLEARETGKPLPEVLQAWGLTPTTPAPPRRSHPLP